MLGNSFMILCKINKRAQGTTIKAPLATDVWKVRNNYTSHVSHSSFIKLTLRY